MKKAFVKTENYARFAAGVKAVEQRGAAEAGMMLVHGQPGYGKSHIVYRWAEEAGAVYLRANVDWTPKYFLVELCKALNIDGRGTAQALFERCLRVLVERQCPIIIDEAEFTLSSNAAVLEKVRDFSDRAEVTVILNEVCKPYFNDRNQSIAFINDDTEFIWWSERSGWGHYYLYSADGQLKSPVTAGEWMADFAPLLASCGKSLSLQSRADAQ